MTNHTLLLGLSAHTWIHAGSGEKDGVVDLPIQREAHTGWPVIFGSSLKGAMRSAATQHQINNLTTLFGPDALSEGASSEKIHAGALMISDARLIWLPVRSLTSHTRYVICPALLRRLQADMARANQPLNLSLPSVNGLTALVAEKQPQTRLYLEEYAFEVESSEEISKWCEILAKFCDLNPEEISQQLALISDDQFAHLCQAAIPVHPHIAINYETKSVKDGALWYEEALPPETLLYTLLIANDARDTSGLKADELHRQISQFLCTEHPYLQVGANESTGMGWLKQTKVEG
jgi:CRISPR-associated RAMP protein, Cmr4 family